MRKIVLTSVVAVMICALFLGCAPGRKALAPFRAQDLGARLKSGELVQKVESFLVILDSSGSMAGSYKAMTKLDYARNVAGRVVKTIPGLKLTAGLRTFGQGASPGQDTRLAYGMRPFSVSGFEGALEGITWANGDSPLAAALDAAGRDLMSASGRIALIVISDGVEMNQKPVSSAKTLKKLYRDRICIYTVQIGKDPAGKKLLEHVAMEGGCGFFVNADKIYGPAGMADFVEKVFFGRIFDHDGDGVPDARDKCPYTPRGAKVNAVGCPPDSDGDGVLDFLDQCPGTPKGVKVNTVGCPLPTDKDGDGVTDDKDLCPGTPPAVRVDKDGCPVDTDKDGVYDYLDRCPKTPVNVRVDLQGCPLDSDGDGVFDYKDRCPGTPKSATVNRFGCWILKGVYFDTAKWRIKKESYPSLRNLVAILKNNPGMKIEIQGHTDNVGSARYNQRLSEKRAKAIMEYLVMNGIQISRLRAVGYGESKPATSNATAEGRAMNRRVELKPIY
ncbi:MAG: OmpA family protein [Deltaproteobacteria bacterium]|nr:OmpA family protein [Deltaproteobacteria bacterium]MBW1923592.1 OmpA family protein [Deltaproteobacteria bacterium]MBW1948584.1 OmpA family protein [Deltaproteobacteria bacterium]MBW2006740.1 OmpA family protein [Deltaproteobacteria bacterium]MBW2349150.1 OmpA family protein [Deltaproteobacteria bacterium]